MGKICLVEAGKFFLGIDITAIKSTRDAERFISDEQEDSPSLFHLASFFSMRSLPFPRGDGIVIEVKNDTGIFTNLLVDRVIGEIEIPSRFEPTPLLYPELAAKCCPQVFIHDEQVVFLLDVIAFISVGEKMQTAHGIFSLDELHNKMIGAEAESEAEAVLEEPATAKVEKRTIENRATYDSPSMDGAVNSVDLKDENGQRLFTQDDTQLSKTLEDASEKMQADIMASTPENIPSAEIPDTRIAEMETVQPATKIDETTFNKIVSWTIGEYLNCDETKPIVITIDMIPPGLLCQQESRNEIVQTLINKTIRRCLKSTRENLRLLKRRSTSRYGIV